MFRSIDPDPAFKPANSDITALELPLDPATDSSTLPWWHFLKRAVEMKNQYEFELNGLLNTYNVVEAECIAGVLLRSKKRRVKVERDYSLRVEVQEAYSYLKSSFYNKAAEFLHNKEDWQAWCLACYYLTYYPRACETTYGVQTGEFNSDDESDSQEWDDETEETTLNLPDSTIFFSFPWIFHEYLLQ